MKTQIEKIINSAIDDFNKNWKSHEERNEGVKCYSEKIIMLIPEFNSFIDRISELENKLSTTKESVKKIQECSCDETTILQLQCLIDSID